MAPTAGEQDNDETTGPASDNPPLSEQEIEAGAAFLLRVMLADLEQYPTFADLPPERQAEILRREREGQQDG
jgi:hypothetical protein